MNIISMPAIFDARMDTSNSDSSPSISERKHWTPEQEKKLLDLCKEYLKKFSNIPWTTSEFRKDVQRVTGFSFEQCHNRYKYIKAQKSNTPQHVEKIRRICSEFMTGNEFDTYNLPLRQKLQNEGIAIREAQWAWNKIQKAKQDEMQKQAMEKGTDKSDEFPQTEIASNLQRQIADESPSLIYLEENLLLRQELRDEGKALIYLENLEDDSPQKTIFEENTKNIVHWTPEQDKKLLDLCKEYLIKYPCVPWRRSDFIKDVERETGFSIERCHKRYKFLKGKKRKMPLHLEKIRKICSEFMIGDKLDVNNLLLRQKLQDEGIAIREAQLAWKKMQRARQDQDEQPEKTTLIYPEDVEADSLKKSTSKKRKKGVNSWTPEQDKELLDLCMEKGTDKSDEFPQTKITSNLQRQIADESPSLIYLEENLLLRQELRDEGKALIYLENVEDDSPQKTIFEENTKNIVHWTPEQDKKLLDLCKEYLIKYPCIPWRRSDFIKDVERETGFSIERCHIRYKFLKEQKRKMPLHLEKIRKICSEFMIGDNLDVNNLLLRQKLQNEGIAIREAQSAWKKMQRARQDQDEQPEKTTLIYPEDVEADSLKKSTSKKRKKEVNSWTPEQDKELLDLGIENDFNMSQNSQTNTLSNLSEWTNEYDEFFSDMTN